MLPVLYLFSRNFSRNALPNFCQFDFEMNEKIISEIIQIQCTLDYPPIRKTTKNTVESI